MGAGTCAPGPRCHSGRRRSAVTPAGFDRAGPTTSGQATGQLPVGFLTPCRAAQ
jgi:hypothetical protein